MLDYRRDRLDYGEQLIPPEGYTLVRAIGATYSVDLNTLLSIPIALFYRQTLEGCLDGERVQLLEAIQRCPKVLRIYHQAGRIHVPRRHNRLYGLLEECVVGVRTQDADSSFHPKVWMLRYEAEGKTTRYRLIVLSRNVTYDRSWDIAATLEGEVTDQPQERNEPLLTFTRYLLDQQTFEGADVFLEDLRCVKFSSPPGFSGNFRFHPIGVGNYRNPVERQRGERLICLSPFVHEYALGNLRAKSSGERWLLGRKEELNKLPTGSLDGFETYALSDLIVEGESLDVAEDGGGEMLQQNLHAKLFVYQQQSGASVWLLGSANATRAALQRNVEFLLELRDTGRSNPFGQLLDELLGTDRMAGVFERFVPSGDAAPDCTKNDLERQVRRLEYELLLPGVIGPARLVRSENGLNWDLLVTLSPNGVAWGPFAVRVSPFNSEHPPQPLPQDGSTELRFENINESSLSRFLRVEIVYGNETQRAFLLKLLVIEGMPEGRVSTIIRGIINDREKFFNYLQFLLTDGADKEALGVQDAPIESGVGADDGGSGSIQSPIYEQLLIAASRRPKRLKDIDDLMGQLILGEEESIVPPDFQAFWRAFRSITSETTR